MFFREVQIARSLDRKHRREIASESVILDAKCRFAFISEIWEEARERSQLATWLELVELGA